VPGTAMTILGIPKKLLFAGVNRVVIRRLIGVGIVACLFLGVGWIANRFLVLRPTKR
jgi:hypothetical protein